MVKCAKNSQNQHQVNKQQTSFSFSTNTTGELNLNMVQYSSNTITQFTMNSFSIN